MVTSDKLFIDNIEELRDWLERNHADSDSVWLVRYKKGFSDNYITYDELVDELICFGWVDSLPRKLDEERTMLRISPRNPQSNWSALNKERVGRLTKNGRMRPSGFELVNKAKSNGAWEFLDDVEKLIIPRDLKLALESRKNALMYFNRFPDSSKRGILEWIKNAKQPATREKRIEETAGKAAQNLKANHPKGRDKGPTIQ